MSVYFLGWDVGPWMCSRDSKDALALLSLNEAQLEVVGKGFRGNLMKKLDGKLSLGALCELAGGKAPDEADVLVLAVDAVFGWPVKFIELTKRACDYSPDPSKPNIENEYLYRHTERFLADALGLKSPHLPKTAVGDALGSPATKVQAVLQKFRSDSAWYVPPLDGWSEQVAASSRRTIIEVYPGAASRSPAFANMLVPRGATVKTLSRSDDSDALKCALNAACYAATVGLVSAPFPRVYTPTAGTSDPVLRCEGWIFSPKP